VKQVNVFHYKPVTSEIGDDIKRVIQQFGTNFMYWLKTLHRVTFFLQYIEDAQF